MNNTPKIFSERHQNAIKALENIKENISVEDYNALKDSLNDVKYNLCQDTYNRLYTSGEVTARNIESAVNSTSFDKWGFIDYLTNRTHRYLCGEIWRLMKSFITTMAKRDERFLDDRNRFVAVQCKRIVENNKTDFEYEYSLEDEVAQVSKKRHHDWAL